MMIPKRRAFYLGSRYGRSDGGNNRKLNVIQRNDHFFLGSRYGKRFDTQFGIDDAEVLSCAYTGVLNLFECKTI